MQFGNINVRTKIKDVLTRNVNSLIHESFCPGYDYYLFIVDEIISGPTLKLLIKDIEAYGYRSYNIVSSVYSEKPEKTSTDYLLSIESNWRKYTTYNDVECAAIFAFGSAVRVLNQSADVLWNHFINHKFNPTRYFLGKEFVNGPDKWVYPVPPTWQIYPLNQGIQGDITNWTTRFFRLQLQKAHNEEKSTKTLDMRDYHIIIAESREDCTEYMDKCCNADLLAIDTETSGLDFTSDKLGTLQFTCDGETGYVTEWKFVDKRKLKQMITSAKRVTLANAKFDMKMLWQNGCKGWYPSDDTTLLAHAMNSNRPKGLKPQTIFECGKFTGYDDELDKAKKKFGTNNYLSLPKNVLYKYAGIDPIVTWRVQRSLDERCHQIDNKLPNEKVKEWTIYKWYKNVMIPNSHVVFDVEFEGVYFDIDEFEKSKSFILSKIDHYRKEMARIWNVDENYNFKSTKRLGILFEKMKWPEIERSKAGYYSTSDDVLAEYDRKGMPGIKELKQFRAWSVGLQTFIEGWGKFLRHHEDDTYRIHPNCNLFGTASYRHSMNDPNFQQIPSRSIMSEQIKRLFTIPPSEIVVTDETTGKIYKGLPNDMINTERGIVRFADLVETDKILE